MNHYSEGLENLCFQDVNNIDDHFYGKGGMFWRSVYNLPKESEQIIVFGDQCEAVQVGIFTFNLGY